MGLVVNAVIFAIQKICYFPQVRITCLVQVEPEADQDSEQKSFVDCSLEREFPLTTNKKIEVCLGIGYVSSEGPTESGDRGSGIWGKRVTTNIVTIKEFPFGQPPS
ncbi:hypothetical protein GDO78_014017 [Eleutherodactylus coqui]|uniref:Uncharacterized protein n=1 Tax=Eleutherodactylus coqui TaxID=57060 RepID=A0A8J6ELG3_ELECQ|nr:hypothetical protein GDO78_014017 [Eleutherodactylus coqui]